VSVDRLQPIADSRSPIADRRSQIADVTVRDDQPHDAADAYVRAHPGASAYHRRTWLDVVEAAFGHETKYLTAEATGRIVGVLPLVFFSSRIFGRFAVSMPFFNYGGVLADAAHVERALLERGIDETRRRNGSHLELRHTSRRFDDLSAKQHKVAMELALAPTADEQWNALDRKVRNQVRKAEKSGLTAAMGGIELVAEFYEVFARNMRDLGTPVYDVRLFREVLTRHADVAHVFVVRHEGRPVAASLVHWHGPVIEVPWASALREFNAHCANVFLYWQMVRFAAERGFRAFDFGRSTPDEGTFHFKKQWGAEPRPLVWEYWMANGQPLPELNPKNPKFDLAIRAWQRLPVRVATTLGPWVVRNIP
jgi:FemAB-related protein (PEP-CTERM system-associated)